MAARRADGPPRPAAKAIDEVLKPTDILVSVTQSKKRTRNSQGGETTPKIRRVEIHWVDAQAVGGSEWVDEDGVQIQGAPSLAMGYVISDTETTISVISLVNSQHYSHGITIPKGCITKLVELR
jgi:hypothetical protein